MAPRLGSAMVSNCGSNAGVDSALVVRVGAVAAGGVPAELPGDPEVHAVTARASQAIR